MARRRRKIKTATMTLRVDPEIKAAAEKAAARDRRSLTNLVEVLLVDHCRSLNLYPSVLPSSGNSK
jgi:predicted HicB family RNase H-like nuclease